MKKKKNKNYSVSIKHRLKISKIHNTLHNYYNFDRPIVIHLVRTQDIVVLE